ncbi:MutS-related protein [Chitinophaga qingshengii]|uniref:DNA mismatch repair proteins mutS family domain-containing protein n=1 Tax=Chitinophaga qingshengii TaxID=1569794 RepID=A0ABR7TTI2_9BACT|nr:hypothetical protein [Chitinophaga qingshengii]MBC9933784.1 hypothetical protein [Chitinophaga qingshengii]
MEHPQLYQQRINDYQQAIDQEKKRTSLLSWARLLSFLLIIAGVILYFRQDREIIWLLAAAAGVVAFGFFLKRHNRSLQQLALLKTLLELNKKEWHQAITGESTFENGQEFVDDRHDYSGDLDVFGPASIFQSINRTGTLSGKQQLAASLAAPMLDPAAILATQEALKVLAPEIEFRQHLTANAMLAKEAASDRRELALWLEMPFSFIHNRFMNIARWLLPALTVAAIATGSYLGHYYLFIGMIMVNWLVLLSIQPRIMEQYKLISQKEQILEKFALLLGLIRKGRFEQSGLLKQQQEVAREADVALQQLSRISSAFDQRLNLLVGIVLNSLLLYDLHCILRLERWKEKHKTAVDKWIEVIAQLEVWNSLATFAYNHPGYTYPQPEAASMILEAEALGHPLIPEKESVKNDGHIGRQASFLIITGSNMSGKSTFLRSVGANLLLAMCGAPVCASRLAFTPMRIMTSMRIKDSIASHTSYFQAELLRLQHIIQQLKTGERVFILLDEILKGTNSEDKLSGSRSLIEHFLVYNCLGMIATHDLELGHLEDNYPDKIRNYCFESTIQDDHLFFDYRIRPGIARNKNATFLMKQMEII